MAHRRPRCADRSAGTLGIRRSLIRGRGQSTIGLHQLAAEGLAAGTEESRLAEPALPRPSIDRRYRARVGRRGREDRPDPTWALLPPGDPWALRPGHHRRRPKGCQGGGRNISAARWTRDEDQGGSWA